MGKKFNPKLSPPSWLQCSRSRAEEQDRQKSALTLLVNGLYWVLVAFGYSGIVWACLQVVWGIYRQAKLLENAVYRKTFVHSSKKQWDHQDCVSGIERHLYFRGFHISSRHGNTYILLSATKARSTELSNQQWWTTFRERHASVYIIKWTLYNGTVKPVRFTE